MGRIFALLACVALAMTTAANAFADPATSSAPAQINGREVVAALRHLLSEHYILPELRAKFDATLAKGMSDGRYDVASPEQLTERINADLHQVTPDKHLGVMYDPEQARQLAAAPPGAGADDAPPSAADILRASRINHGIAELKLLPGNIRYMRYDGFVWAGPKTAQALDDAMRFLRDGDAAVIDLRGNGGGSPEAVRYIVSHFVEPNRPIVTFYMGGAPAKHSSTLASLPVGRMIGKPLYVLTSGMSASAAEEFIGHVAGLKLGEVIGENSAGAGFRNEFYPLPYGMVISISVGRAVLVSTGKDWEGVGIAPTTAVDAGNALDVAQTHALRRLASNASGADKRALEARASALEAKLNPVATALPLDRYAGAFGDRTIAVESGTLTFRRQGAPKHQLIAIEPSQFIFEDDPMTRVRFMITGDAVTALELLRSDGTTAQAPRTR